MFRHWNFELVAGCLGLAAIAISLFYPPAWVYFGPLILVLCVYAFFHGAIARRRR